MAPVVWVNCDGKYITCAVSAIVVCLEMDEMWKDYFGNLLFEEIPVLYNRVVTA